jgi:Domain of unknown function (DUF2760)
LGYGPRVNELSFVTRLWFAWVCFFRVLFDGAFASSVWRVRSAQPLPPAAKPAERAPELPAPAADPALQLLSILQREGRLVDFLEQDIASFSDADVGAAARVVHDGCQKALRAHAKVLPVRSEEEGAKITVPAGFEPALLKLTGNVQGSAPYTGTLRHRGWRATDLTLPRTVAGYDPTVIAPAEVEL